MNCESVAIDGIVITRDMFEGAKEAGIKRWETYARGKAPNGDCKFCLIFGPIGMNNCLRGKTRTDCPVWDGKVLPSRCCTEWSKWTQLTYKGFCPGDGIAEAKAVLARIRALDWNEWAEKYAPKETPVKETKVTVLTFDKDGTQGSYSFRGSPDWTRIAHEMIADGLMAVIVKGHVFYNVLQKDTLIFHKCLSFPGVLTHRLHFGCKAIFISNNYGEHISQIRRAISDWKAAQPKPGQPRAIPKVTITIEQAGAVKAAILSENTVPAPAMPGAIRAIYSLVERPNSDTQKERQKWTREIAGVKVRAYENRFGVIALSTEGEDAHKDISILTREFCQLAGIPIMPYKLHKGTVPEPEVEK